MTNLGDVRRYLTLPATGPHGATVSWSSADPVTDPARPTGERNWFTGPVSLVIEASDPSGVASREYRIDGGAWQTHTRAIRIPAGVTKVRYRATDTKGNVSTVDTVTVKRDWQRPTAEASFTDWPGPVEVMLTAADEAGNVSLTGKVRAGVG